MTVPRILTIPDDLQPSEFLEELKQAGYCRISRKYGIVARIDRRDWDVFQEQQGNPISADWYRRCVSKDVVQIPLNGSDLLPTDSYSPHYRPPGRFGIDVVPENPKTLREDFDAERAEINRLRLQVAELTAAKAPSDLLIATQKETLRLRGVIAMRDVAIKHLNEQIAELTKPAPPCNEPVQWTKALINRYCTRSRGHKGAHDFQTAQDKPALAPELIALNDRLEEIVRGLMNAGISIAPGRPGPWISDRLAALESVILVLLDAGNADGSYVFGSSVRSAFGRKA